MPTEKTVLAPKILFHLNIMTLTKSIILKHILKAVLTTFLLVCFVSLNKTTCETRKLFRYLKS